MFAITNFMTMTCNSCMIVTVEIAVTVMDVKVVAGVLNGTDEMRDS